MKDSPATAVILSIGRTKGGPKTRSLAECLMEESPLLAVHCCTFWQERKREEIKQSDLRHAKRSGSVRPVFHWRVLDIITHIQLARQITRI